MSHVKAKSLNQVFVLGNGSQVKVEFTLVDAVEGGRVQTSCMVLATKPPVSQPHGSPPYRWMVALGELSLAWVSFMGFPCNHKHVRMKTITRGITIVP